MLATMRDGAVSEIFDADRWAAVDGFDRLHPFLNTALLRLAAVEGLAGGFDDLDVVGVVGVDGLEDGLAGGGEVLEVLGAFE